MYKKYLEEGLARLSADMHITLEEYQGIKPGFKGKLVNTDEFGFHWKGKLGYNYIIEEIYLTSMGQRVGLLPETGEYDPSLVNVKIRSVEDPSFTSTIGINHFSQL